MVVYIAFLRGINVGGHKKIPMAELRLLLAEVGLNNVKTYIQSGNIVFESTIKSTITLAKLIQNSIEEKFGFKVPALVKMAKELEQIFLSNPYNSEAYLENNQTYFVLLFELPIKELVVLFNEERYPNEEFYFSDNCIYLLCKKGYGNAKLNNNLLERKLKVTATARNYRTMQKLLELAS